MGSVGFKDGYRVGLSLRLGESRLSLEELRLGESLRLGEPRLSLEELRLGESRLSLEELRLGLSLRLGEPRLTAPGNATDGPPSSITEVDNLRLYNGFATGDNLRAGRRERDFFTGEEDDEVDLELEDEPDELDCFLDTGVGTLTTGDCFLAGDEDLDDSDELDNFLINFLDFLTGIGNGDDAEDELELDIFLDFLTTFLVGGDFLLAGDGLGEAKTSRGDSFRAFLYTTIGDLLRDFLFS